MLHPADFEHEIDQLWLLVAQVMKIEVLQASSNSSAAGASIADVPPPSFTQGKLYQALERSARAKAAAAAAQDSAASPNMQPQQLQSLLQAELAALLIKVLALMRLRRFSAAGDELSQLGDLAEQQLAGCRSGPMPFGLLFLSALLPQQLDNADLSTDRLYQLRHYCEQQLAVALLQPPPQQQQQSMAKQSRQQQEQEQLQADDVEPGADAKCLPDQQQQHVHRGGPHVTKQDPSSTAAAAAKAAAVKLWQQRLQGVSCQLVLHHWEAGRVTAALQLLEQLLSAAPADVGLWSLAGRMQLQLHCTAAARSSFSMVQQLVEGAAAAERVALQQLVHHNWGCLHALSNSMAAAATEFEAAQRSLMNAAGSSSVDGVAAANAAVCLLYQGQLTEAISALETGLQQHLPAMLQTCTLHNLGQLYDLAYPAASGKEARHSMASTLLRHIPDDFDLSCIEPQHA